MKRIFLFVITNLAILLVLSVMFEVVCALIGPEALAQLSHAGFNYGYVATWALVFGLGGAAISLLLSKPIAKWSTHATTIDGSEGATERWLVETVRQLAERAGVKMPEVAIYPGAANAFATGAFKHHALVAVSTGILQDMNRDELRAVLGHEMSHVANGDMVTLALVQGVLNACVLFLARVIGFFAASAFSGGKNDRGGSSRGVYLLVYYVMQILLGLVASLVVCAYSRRREYAADRGSATLLGTPTPMIAALRRLGGLAGEPLPDSLQAFGIRGGAATLFATHPPITARIRALEQFYVQ